MKKTVLNVLEDDIECTPPSYLTGAHADLKQLGTRNLCNEIFPLSLLHSVHMDLLAARRTLAKIIRFFMTRLHRLWVERCNFIYMNTVEEVSIEEFQEQE